MNRYQSVATLVLLFLVAAIFAADETRRTTTPWPYKGCLKIAPDDVLRALEGECGSTRSRAKREQSPTNFPKIDRTDRPSTKAPVVPVLEGPEKTFACILQKLNSLVTPNGINFGAVNRRIDVLKTDNRQIKNQLKEASAECIKITPKDKKSDVQVPIFSKCAVEKLRKICPEYFS